jgi:hypothetical protein
MKHTIKWFFIVVVVSAICSLTTYRISYYHGFKHGYWSGVDTAMGVDHLFQSVGALTVLQKIQAGDVPLATHILETNCFDSAHIFYEKPVHIEEARQWLSPKELFYYPDAATSKQIGQELSKYRAAYRTNSADWDVMEQKLAIELANLK